jgi:hypothetical protein
LDRLSARPGKGEMRGLQGSRGEDGKPQGLKPISFPA